MPWLSPSIKSKARQLYKEFVWMSKRYPKDGDRVLARVKREFVQLENEKDEKTIKQALAKGRWYLKEYQAVTQFHKYRKMNEAYGKEGEENRVF